MNVGRVYTTPTFNARGIDPLTRGIGAHHEYWKGVQPSNIHCEGERPLDKGIGARDEYWKGVFTAPTFIARGIDPTTRNIGTSDDYWKGAHPSNIHREGYRPLDTGKRGTR